MMSEQLDLFAEAAVAAAGERAETELPVLEEAPPADKAAQYEAVREPALGCVKDLMLRLWPSTSMSLSNGRISVSGPAAIGTRSSFAIGASAIFLTVKETVAGSLSCAPSLATNVSESEPKKSGSGV